MNIASQKADKNLIFTFVSSKDRIMPYLRPSVAMFDREQNNVGITQNKASYGTTGQRLSDRIIYAEKTIKTSHPQKRV